MQSLKERNEPLYITLVNTINREIKNGVFRPGDKMYPIREICKNYNVSQMTAVRGMNTLREMGVLKTVPRKGTFVNGIPKQNVKLSEAKQVKQIVVLTEHTLHKGGYYDKICQAVFKASRNFEIDVRFVHLPTELRQEQNLAFSLQADDAVIAVASHLSLSLYSILKTPDLKRILIDSAIPSVPCVLTNNYDGIRQLLFHLKELGHYKVALSWGEVSSPNQTNENERREAFEFFANQLSLEYEIINDTTLENIIPLCKRPDAPTAILFTSDDSAVHFIELAEKAGICVPGDISVTGFDDWSNRSYDLSRLTTVRNCPQQIGLNAVDYLVNSDINKNSYNRWIRIPCKLQIRKSTGKPSKSS